MQSRSSIPSHNSNGLIREFEDPRRNDHRVHTRREPTSGSIHYPQHLLVNRSLQVPRRETLRCMHCLGRFWSCICRNIPRGYGGWWCDDGPSTSGSPGARRPKSVVLDSPIARWVNCRSPALQGTARMALQPGAHPARIKDAVTSKHPSFVW